MPRRPAGAARRARDNEPKCYSLMALHVLVWHTAVVPVSAAAGALLGWALAQRRRLA